VLAVQRAGDERDVLALVAALGEHRRRADQFQVARANGVPQDAHLAAGIIEVILPRHPVSGSLEQARHRITEHGIAPVPDGERPGGVRAHEFHHHGAPLAEGRRPIVRASISASACSQKRREKRKLM